MEQSSTSTISIASTDSVRAPRQKVSFPQLDMQTVMQLPDLPKHKRAKPAVGTAEKSDKKKRSATRSGKSSVVSGKSSGKVTSRSGPVTAPAVTTTDTTAAASLSVATSRAASAASNRPATSQSGKRSHHDYFKGTKLEKLERHLRIKQQRDEEELARHTQKAAAAAAAAVIPPLAAPRLVLLQPLYCVSCGKRRKESAVFCPHCGYQLVRDKPATPLHTFTRLPEITERHKLRKAPAETDTSLTQWVEVDREAFTAWQQAQHQQFMRQYGVQHTGEPPSIGLQAQYVNHLLDVTAQRPTDAEKLQVLMSPHQPTMEKPRNRTPRRIIQKKLAFGP
eukprot:TRINITY_DN2911_c1_g6_i1.p1 TRINITY_DN2911_c1_g6~~TRINITY_DN2911_c1_g6_i1.p1  ORF type:complete len:363 (+),score=103.53 TRINITY_DN2911_c1_g6_i1:83-1090(+)